MARHGGLVAGVDEAGRGPWAGPVVAAAVAFRTEGAIPEGLDDSKKLSEARREALYEQFLAGAAAGDVLIGVAEFSPQEIDRLNILAASLAAMAEAVKALPIAPGSLLVDGNKLPKTPLPAEALVKGDGRSLAIAAASIVAKVRRDREMRALDEAFPVYQWARNKGYGTRAHQAALAEFGVSPHHRRSFKPVRALLAVG